MARLAKADLLPIAWTWTEEMVMVGQWMSPLPGCLHTFRYGPVAVFMEGDGGGEHKVAGGSILVSTIPVPSN